LSAVGMGAQEPGGMCAEKEGENDSGVNAVIRTWLANRFADSKFVEEKATVWHGGKI